MAAGNFDRCLARILVYEGGNDDDPRDPGGRTSRGIIQREYDRYLVRHGLGAVVASRDVWKASDADVRQIYRENYWDRMRCEELPSGIDITVFDGGVNSGVAQQAKWAQRACNIKVDGDFGPATVLALTSANDNDALIGEMLKRRLAMLQSLKTWKVFGKGWAARVSNVLKIAQAWATGSVGPDPVAVHVIGGHRKGKIEDVKKPIISVDASQIATAAGAGSTGLTQVAQQMQPVADQVATVPWLRWVSYGLTAITAAAIVLGIVATIAENRAAAARSAESTVEVDPEADQVIVGLSIAVNDNALMAQAGAA